MAPKACPAQEAPAVRLHSFPHSPPPPPATLQKPRQTPGQLEAVQESWERCSVTLLAPTPPSDATQRGGLAQLTVRNNGTFSSLSTRLLFFFFFAIIRPRLTLQWVLNIKNKNVQKKSPAGYVCVCICCVSIRACAKSPNVTVCNPNKRAEESEIFPGIPSSCLLCFSTPRGRSGAFSNRRCSYRSDTYQRRLPLFFRSQPSPESRAQGFLPVPLFYSATG